MIVNRTLFILMPERILVAVAWPYASGPRHIGHMAGLGPSDIFARYHRMKGNDVLMVSGTDDHGTPSMIAADKEGVPVGDLVSRYNRLIAEDLKALGMTYDIFTRTETANHRRVAQDLFKTLYERGFIVRGTMLGSFAAGTGRTLPDRYIEGTCPICGYDGARGDQCDNCGNQLDPTDLVAPRSTIDGKPPEFRETEHFFLDLPAFAGRLSDWIVEQGHWRPNVRNFSLNYAKDLKRRPITRDLDWGIPIPLPEYEGRDDKRMYVWFEAVIGYLSASIEWAAARGTPDAWREWWQNPDSRHYYFMGKDNIAFHTAIWPSMLMGYASGGDFGAGKADLVLPYDIAATEYLTTEGRKYSVSRGIAIYIGDFLSRYEPDSLRYYLTAAGPETQDTDFTWVEFVRRNNDELVATWGNLANRTLSMAHRNYGEVPAPSDLNDVDQRLVESVEQAFGEVGQLIAAVRFKPAINKALATADKVNQYFSQQEPWKAAPDRARTIIYVALKCVDSLKIIMTPFLPFSSQRLHELLGHQGTIAGFPEMTSSTEEDGSTHLVLGGDYSKSNGRWEASRLAPGQKLPRPEPLFRKLEDSVIAEELARMEGAGSG